MGVDPGFLSEAVLDAVYGILGTTVGMRVWRGVVAVTEAAGGGARPFALTTAVSCCTSAWAVEFATRKRVVEAGGGECGETCTVCGGVIC